MAQIAFVIKFLSIFQCISLKGPNISNHAIILFKMHGLINNIYKITAITNINDAPLHMTCKLGAIPTWPWLVVSMFNNCVRSIQVW
jgi:type III secretory pathway component EscS